MPFTPTHILAAIPIGYIFRRVSFSALAIGSIVPDFPLFYPIAGYDFSHSLVGLIGYCLPVGILTYYLFELVGKVFIIDLSPIWIKSRINHYRNSKPEYSLNNFVLLAIAIVAGSLTHIIWDGFTHKASWGVQLIDQLNQQVDLFIVTLPGYKLLQYGSTIFGLPLLCILTLIYLRGIKPDITCQYYPLAKPLLVTIISSFLVIPVIITGYSWYQTESFKSLVGIVIKQSIGAGIVLFFLYALLYRSFLFDRK